MENSDISIAYQTHPRDRPLAAISVRAAAGNPRRGWLTAGGRTVPVALGRGGIMANKREGDGGTPTGTPAGPRHGARRRLVRRPSKPPLQPTGAAGRGPQRRPANAR